MRMRLLWVGAPLLCFGLVGCLDELAEATAGPHTSSWGAVVVNTSGSTTLSYSNGHPIIFESTDEAARQFEREVEALTNNHRIAMGLPALLSSDAVGDVARAHSVHMIVHDPAFFDHSNPEGDRPMDRAARSGIACEACGENIAAGYATPESVFTAWLDSEGHRANLENPEWTGQGVGYAYTPSDPSHHYDYCTQNFTR